MQPYQQRVINERDDLAEKLDKLTKFGETDVFDNLSLEDQQLLDNQWDFMSLYLDCLNRRIAKFSL